MDSGHRLTIGSVEAVGIVNASRIRDEKEKTMMARRPKWLRGPQHRVIAAALFSLLLIATSASAQNSFPASGNVGVGTANPVDTLHIFGLNTPRIRFDGNTGTNWFFQFTSSDNSFRLGATGVDVMTLTTAGRVGIGTANPSAKLHVAGDAVVDGNIGAKYQDVAEWVRTSAPLAPGTVVVIDVGNTDSVAASRASYDTRVAGVVSPRPGLLLGEAGPDKAMVAHSGRVRVRVDATYGSIAVGDLLVTSPTLGYAMRSEPVSVGGAVFHRPGTLLGKALEPLRSGQGEILVLLTLQ